MSPPPLAVAAILVVVVHPLVGLTLALLFRCAAGAVAAAVLAALAVVPLVGAAPVSHGFHALVPFLRGRRVRALVHGRMALLLLAPVVVVPRNHGSSSGPKPS